MANGVVFQDRIYRIKTFCLKKNLMLFKDIVHHMVCLLLFFFHFLYNVCIFLFPALDKVYGCVVDMQDNLVRKTDGGFSEEEYLQHPDRYASTFSVKVQKAISNKATLFTRISDCGHIREVAFGNSHTPIVTFSL